MAKKKSVKTSSMTMTSSRKRVELRNVDVWSCAKLSGILGVFMGLIIGVIYFMIFSFAGVFSSSLSGDTAAGAGMVFLGFLAVIGLPVVYGVFCALFGALYAWIYNVAASRFGGVEMVLRMK